MRSKEALKRQGARMREAPRFQSGSLASLALHAYAYSAWGIKDFPSERFGLNIKGTGGRELLQSKYRAGGRLQNTRGDDPP